MGGLDGIWVYNKNCFLEQSRTLNNPPSHMRPREVETGYRLSDEIGLDIRPLDAQNSGDFVDVNGKIYDAMGMPEAYTYWNEKQFLKSIDDHLNKSVDHVVIDLNGANHIQKEIILNHLSNLNNSNINNVIFVGD